MHAMTLPRRHDAVDCAVLPELLDLYLADKRRENAISARTEESYRRHLSPFLTWFAARTDKRLSPEALNEFVAWMRADHRTRYGACLRITGTPRTAWPHAPSSNAS